MSDDKYLFKLYSFDDDGNMLAPFAGDDGQYLYGKKYMSRGPRRESSFDGASRILMHDGGLFPTSDLHVGFSALGRMDPHVSIFGLSDIDLPGVGEGLQKEAAKLIPEQFKNMHELRDRYTASMRNDYDWYYNNGNIRLGALAKCLGYDTPGKFTLSPESFDFDSDSVWDDLVNNVDMYNTMLDKSKVVLATAPVRDIITADDITREGLTAQRDFPSEIVTRSITPIRVFSEYPEAYHRYASARAKGASGRDAFADAFRLEPDDVSDVNMKRIYKDCAGYAKRLRTQENVAGALEGLI